MRKHLLKPECHLRRLKGLHNASNRKEQALRQFDPVTYKALELLRRMKQAGRFNGEAYEPVRLCISASDPRFAAAIEGSLDRPTLMVSAQFSLSVEAFSSDCHGPRRFCSPKKPTIRHS